MKKQKDFIPRGLSRFSDTYKDLGLKYGERVRLEQCLSHKDVSILAFIAKNEHSSLAQIQKSLGSAYLDRLLEKGFVEKQKNRYVITKTGQDIIEAISANIREII